MTIRILPAIMSGGSGTRLWPASTEARPKQFHALGGAGTLIGETVARVRGQAGALSFAPPMMQANVSHAELIAEALAAISVQPTAIVLEPAARNTAAVGAIAAALGAELEPEALVLLLPADHQINDRAAFLAAIERAAPFARERIVTFGINPDRPETGYGYIKRGAELGAGVYAIDSFREKPNDATARAYLEHGGYAWNSGMFLFSPRVMLEEFAQSADVRDAALEALRLARRHGVEIRLDETAFNKTPSMPLDIAVMEKTKRGAVAPCDIGWADLGSWDEIWRLSPKDGAGNAVHGKVVTLDADGNLLRADGVTLSVAGVSDLIVIATGDAVLILPRSRAQDVKRLKELAEKL
ncbi:mannose-1-phosphate guanylyltransferase [alpha proteobacterium U9-1i]|nr:mannose-1-phosphate guanylyltransferase [alpha proteobacterium U9-1i]